MKKIFFKGLLSLVIFCLLSACNSNEKDPLPSEDSPVIWEFTPAEGAAGVKVSISGLNFSDDPSNIIVKIDGKEAEVVTADSFNIEAIVPEGATTGKISVTVNNKSTTSNDIFTVLYSPWKRKADFGGGTRFVGVGFAIGNKGYAGTGVGDVNSMQDDFWEYDPSTNKWKQVADFIGSGIQQGIGFSIGDKGYVGLGTVGGSSTHTFYEYNPATNAWTEKNVFPGYGRSGAVAFSVGNKGYVSTGASSWETFSDLWEYDPTTDSWTKKADFPGGPRYRAVGFSIGDKAYVGMGSANGSSYKDFWEYNPATNSWTQKSDLPETILFYSTAVKNRSSAVAFSIGNKGYICTGVASSYRMKDLWEYDPSTDKWTQLEDLAGASRSDAFGFSIGNKGYVGCGSGSSDLTDFWELNFQQ